MSVIIYLLGPSGVGKSTIAKKVSEINSAYKIIELDRINGSHDEKLEKSNKLILDLENKNNKNIYIIDVGAFFQYYSDNKKFWEPRKDRMITLMNTKNFCFNNYNSRQGKLRKSRGEWAKKEFSETRKELYNLARYQVDTNKEIPQTLGEVLAYIKKIIFSN